MTAELTTPTVADLDAVFKGFADPTRIRILSVLAAGELCVCDIVDVLRLPQPAVSRHLAYLRRDGTRRREARVEVCAVSPCETRGCRAPEPPRVRSHPFPRRRVAGSGARCS